MEIPTYVIEKHKTNKKTINTASEREENNKPNSTILI